ncbi:MAG: hypothetical protein WB421_18515 [Terriglobales bacterium]|jgi:hypothetical protein
MPMVRFVGMSPSSRKFLCAALVWLVASCTVRGQNTETVRPSDGTVAGARTVTYCDVQQHPEKYSNSMIRVRALYETDFEKSVISAPSCSTPLPMTWVSFDKHWESRTARRVRHAISNAKPGVQMDVVFVGVFKTDAHYGHMDMYPNLIEVNKVEAAKASGDFRPMPEQ